MKQPNFFILGGPKCGTTSMADWLSEHPHVFMSPVKEPFFFCTDLVPDLPRKVAEYEELFRGAHPVHCVIGEATTSYLYSKLAVPNILNYSPEAVFLVMIRNPVEMAYSLHSELLYQGDEHVEDFEKAWALQGERRQGRAVGPLCRDPQLLLYGPYCKLGAQIARLMRTVPRQSFHVVNLDDLKRAPAVEYSKLLEFLHLEGDNRSEFPVHNEAKERRFPLLARLMRPIQDLRQRLGPTYRGLGILKQLSDWNRVSRPRQPLTGEMQTILRDYFRQDVCLLSELLERDLTQWVEE